MNAAHKAWATRRAKAARVGFAEDVQLATIADFVDDAGILASSLGVARDVAGKLLGEFGALGSVLAAPTSRLLAAGLDSATAERAKAIQATVARVLRSDVSGKPVMTSWSAVLDYLRARIAFEPIEQFRVLFLDKRNRLISDDRLSTGTVDHAPVYPREVAKRAIELDATAVILTHNHPSGDPTPSAADIAMTKDIVAALKVFGIVVHDHVVIGQDGHTSFKQTGLL